MEGAAERDCVRPYLLTLVAKLWSSTAVGETTEDASVQLACHDRSPES